MLLTNRQNPSESTLKLINELFKMSYLQIIYKIIKINIVLKRIGTGRS